MTVHSAQAQFKDEKLAKTKPEARPQRIHQAIARQLGTAILLGEYQPGDCFEGEIEKSAAMGVSRTPYREAIRTLVSKGLLESRPKAGTHVTPRQRWNLLDPEILAWMFSGQPDPAFIRDLFELRGILEPAAAALAAHRSTPQQLDAMAEALAVMGEHGLATSAGQEADRSFHRLILEAAGNDALASLSSSVGAAVQWTTHYKQRASLTPRDPYAEHVAVHAAIAAGDAKGSSAAMALLIDHALDDMASPAA